MEQDLKINFNPSENELAQIKIFLLDEDRDFHEGFYCNWPLIEDAYASKRIFSFHYDDECIGFVEFRDHDFLVDIDRFVVKREYRKRGTGRYFIGELLRYWEEHRRTAVRLFCEPKISAGFWRRMGFIQLPLTDLWKELTFYINLIPVLEPTDNPDPLNKVELWNLPPNEIKLSKPTWAWNFASRRGDRPILHACHHKWNLKITRDGEVVSEGNVSRVSDAGSRICFSPFLYINK